MAQARVCFAHYLYSKNGTRLSLFNSNLHFQILTLSFLPSPPPATAAATDTDPPHSFPRHRIIFFKTPKQKKLFNYFCFALQKKNKKNIHFRKTWHQSLLSTPFSIMTAPPLDLVYELLVEFGWDAAFATSAKREYNRWLNLRAKSQDFETCRLPPSRVVAMVWNVHRQWTLDYSNVCNALGGYIHHYPPSMRVNVAMEHAYNLTLQMYRAEYKQDPPLDYWGPSICGSPNASLRPDHDVLVNKRSPVDDRPGVPMSSSRSLRAKKRVGRPSAASQLHLSPTASAPASAAPGAGPGPGPGGGAAATLAVGTAMGPNVGATTSSVVARAPLSHPPIAPPTTPLKGPSKGPSPPPRVDRRTSRKSSTPDRALRPLRPGEKRRRGRPSAKEYISLGQPGLLPGAPPTSISAPTSPLNPTSTETATATARGSTTPKSPGRVGRPRRVKTIPTKPTEPNSLQKVIKQVVQGAASFRPLVQTIAPRPDAAPGSPPNPAKPATAASTSHATAPATSSATAPAPTSAATDVTAATAAAAAAVTGIAAAPVIPTAPIVAAALAAAASPVAVAEKAVAVAAATGTLQNPKMGALENGTASAGPNPISFKRPRGRPRKDGSWPRPRIGAGATPAKKPSPTPPAKPLPAKLAPPAVAAAPLVPVAKVPEKNVAMPPAPVVPAVVEKKNDGPTMTDVPAPGGTEAAAPSVDTPMRDILNPTLPVPGVPDVPPAAKA